MGTWHLTPHLTLLPTVGLLASKQSIAVHSLGKHTLNSLFPSVDCFAEPFSFLSVLNSLYVPVLPCAEGSQSHTRSKWIMNQCEPPHQATITCIFGYVP